MIQIQHRALCALEQDAFSGFSLFVKYLPHWRGIRQYLWRNLHQRRFQPNAVNLRQAKATAQRIVVAVK